MTDKVFAWEDENTSNNFTKSPEYQKFTPAEQKCISENISEKVKEGMDQDQAIAASINICAPEKARKSQADVAGEYQATKPASQLKIGDVVLDKEGVEFRVTKVERRGNKIFFETKGFGPGPSPSGTVDANSQIRIGSKFSYSDLPGGKYIAVKNSDGTYTIKNVPIFAPHKRFGKTITKKWLHEAVNRHKTLFKEGNLPSINIGHMRDDKDDPVGYAIITRVDEITYKGKLTPVLISDLVISDEETYGKFKDEKIPYLSVELADMEDPQIGTISLLKTRKPYFDFARITIGAEVNGNKKELKPVMANSYDMPLVAYCYSADSKSANFLFNFQGEDMPDIDVKERKEGRAEIAQDENEEKKDEKKEEKAQADDMQQAIFQLLEKIADKMGVGKEEEMQEEKDLKPVENPEHREDEKEEKMSANMPAEYAARFTSLEAEVKAIKREKKVVELVSYAQKKLAAYNLGDQAVDDIRYQALHGGKEAVERYISTIERVGSTVPPETFEKYEKTLSSQLPEEVKSYASKSPEEFAAVKTIYSWYQELGETFAKSNPLDKFIKREMKRMKDEKKKVKNIVI